MKAPAPPDPDGPQRLAKIVALQAQCSRREAEQYITEGWVRVDGKVVELPQHRVTAGQRVEIARDANLAKIEPATLLVHKPAGMDAAALQALLRDATHWDGDASGVRPARSHLFGLMHLLPLPTPASGLAVFSQDVRIVRKLRDDGRFLEQELVADVTGTIADNGLARLRRGLVHEGRPMPPCQASWQNETRLRLAVKDIPPEAVPWMCAQVGLTLTALKRIRLGRIPMAALPPGRWRYLGPHERF